MRTLTHTLLHFLGTSVGLCWLRRDKALGTRILSVYFTADFHQLAMASNSLSLQRSGRTDALATAPRPPSSVSVFLPVTWDSVFLEDFKEEFTRDSTGPRSLSWRIML